MNKTKIAFSSFAFLIVCLLSFTNSLAQTPPKIQFEPSYEVVLQTLIGSNLANNKSDVPQTLSGVVKKLKINYSYSNYGLGSTLLQRVANTGTVELKSVSSETIPNQERSLTVFSEWTLRNLQNVPGENGQSSIQFENFTFGQRIPTVVNVRDDNGRSNPMVNYERIGLTLQKFNLAANTPTIVGSLSTTKPDELMFLVLTVRPAQ